MFKYSHQNQVHTSIACLVLEGWNLTGIILLVMDQKWVWVHSVVQFAYIDYINLKLNILSSRQDIKILLHRFWATNMMIIPVKFQPSRTKGVDGVRGDIETHGLMPFSGNPYTNF